MVVFDSLATLYRSSRLYSRRLSARPPRGWLFRPAPLGLGDVRAGQDVLSGRYELAGHALTLGPDPWTVPVANAAVYQDLHAFTWLPDLMTLGEQGAAHAQGLLTGWMDRYGTWSAAAWRPEVTARRVLAWLDQSSVLFAAGTTVDAHLLGLLGAQATHLIASGIPASGSIAALEITAAQVAAVSCLDGYQDRYDAALARLEKELVEAVLPDGGHVSRSPIAQMRALHALLIVRACSQGQQNSTPTQVQGAIDRMTPALRAFRHEDGGLACFNGGFFGPRKSISALLKASKQTGKAPPALPHTGYTVLQAAKTKVIVDVGPGQGSPAPSHAGLAAFEFSAGKHRIIVNLGAHPDPGSDWAQVLATTAAHSTLVIDDTNAANLASKQSHPDVGSRRIDREGSTLLQVTHEGYRQAFGVLHNRDLYLSADGNDFRGKDRIIGGAGQRYDLRFHLGPQVNASMLSSGTAVLLRLDDRTGWRFRMSGPGEVRLEDSIFVGDPAKPKRTMQILITGRLDVQETILKWSFVRELK